MTAGAAAPEAAEAPPADLVHAWSMLVALTLAIATGRRAVLVGLAWLAFGRFVWRGRAAWLPMRFGPPNAVTLVRLGLVSALALGAQSYGGAALAGLGLLVYALDGLDGLLARRWGFASAFGAAFDVETDGYYVAALGVALWGRGVAGAWVLVPGFLRYAHVLTVHHFRWRGEAPRRRYARYAFSVLAVLFSLALLPTAAAPWAAAAAAAVVTTSFAKSWWWASRVVAPAPS